MQKSQQIGAVILGAAAAYAIYKLYQMPKHEREQLVNRIKDKAQVILEDSDKTVEKVQHYVTQMKGTEPDQWLDKLYLLKKMFNEIFGGKTTEYKPSRMPMSTPMGTN